MDPQSIPRKQPKVSGDKEKPHGGKVGPKVGGRTPTSHSARAGLVVSLIVFLVISTLELWYLVDCFRVASR